MECQKMQNYFNLNVPFHAEITTYSPSSLIKYHLMHFHSCYLNNLKAIRLNSGDISVSNLQSLTKITFKHSFSKENIPKKY